MQKTWVPSALLLSAVVLLSATPAAAAGKPPAKSKPSPGHSQKHPVQKPARPRLPPTPPNGWPKTLVIPRIGVRAHVEDIDLRNPKEAEAPFNWGDVAWYDRGAKPGGEGHAEIYGHLDSTCCPAVFYYLRNLRKGDQIQVYYKTGRPVTFTVQWVAEYPNGKLPLKFLYGPTYDHGLTLLTCDGIFHYDGTGYDHKLIVYAKLNY